ncbi:MAG: carboxypeptidase-like regulatory domain-containing protein [bacterium]
MTMSKKSTVFCAIFSALFICACGGGGSDEPQSVVSSSDSGVTGNNNSSNSDTDSGVVNQQPLSDSGTATSDSTPAPKTDSGLPKTDSQVPATDSSVPATDSTSHSIDSKANPPDCIRDINLIKAELYPKALEVPDGEYFEVYGQANSVQPGVTVAFLYPLTNLSGSTTSDSDGTFSFWNLPNKNVAAGSKVSITAEGAGCNTVKADISVVQLQLQ